MEQPFLIIRRHPYEEPYLVELEFIISNGFFSSSIDDIYCTVEDIDQMGKTLKEFPKKVPDEYRYEYEIGKPEDDYYRYFSLKISTRNSVGDSFLQFQINIDPEEPGWALYGGMCKLYFPAEAAGINHLGRMLEQFRKLEYLELRWNAVNGKLYEEYQKLEVGII